MGMPKCLTPRAKCDPGLAASTLHAVVHRYGPHRFLPLKRAPSDGPLAPPTQWHRVVSGLHLPIWVMSLTRSYRAAGLAAMTREIVTSATERILTGGRRVAPSPSKRAARTSGTSAGAPAAGMPASLGHGRPSLDRGTEAPMTLCSTFGGWERFGGHRRCNENG